MTGPFALSLLYESNAIIGKFRLQRIRARANDHDDISRIKGFCSGNDMREYGFARNKGYGSKGHMDAIAQHGITPLHRASWIKK